MQLWDKWLAIYIWSSRETLNCLEPMSTQKSHPANPTDHDRLRSLPSVNELADSPSLSHWSEVLPRELMVLAARQVISKCRQEILFKDRTAPASFEDLIKSVNSQLEQDRQFALPQVINATGILLHTGLGRSPLSNRAISAIALASSDYTPLEIDLRSGERGQRADVVRRQLCDLTGSECATLVNNNSAALLITLNTLAAGKEVIVSRGELIEIGGSFRLPEIMAASGAQLREVGTTNKTRVSDYAAAINDSTGMLLKVHPSNYQLSGFTQSVSIAELVALGRSHNLPVIHDIGSGALFDLTQFGFGDEPVARVSIEAGADLVLFSGDKLLGGPQAGMIVGRGQLVGRIEKNPLFRALRVDKLTLAALSATLSSLHHPQTAVRELPLWMMIAISIEELRERARHIADEVKSRTSGSTVDVTTTAAYLGGGSVPNQRLESVAVTLAGGNTSEWEIAQRLRIGTPPVVGRLERGRVIIDLRAVLPRQDENLIDALVAALQA
jgi:L-seryl-tRNA(Ser) seleniumtransferase